MNLKWLSKTLDRADDLVAASDWRGLLALLGPLEQGTILASDSLAYRFGEALFHLGHMAELGTFADSYLHAARDASNPEGTMRALNLCGIAAFELGLTRVAGGHFEALQEIATAEGRHDMLARAANNLGALSNLQGRHERALSYYRMAIPLYQRQAETRGLAQTQHNLGLTFRDLGQFQEAESAYRKAAELAESFGYTPIVAMSTVGRGEVAALSGDGLWGRALASRGIEMARELGDPITEGVGLRVRGLALSASAGDKSRAVTDLEAALELADQTGHRLLEAEVHRDFGFLFASQQNWPEARSHLTSACELFGDLGAEGQLAATRVRLERLPSH